MAVGRELHLAGVPRFRGFRAGLRGDYVGGLIAGLAVVYLVALPLVILLFSSFRDTTTKLPFEDTTFTLQNYVAVFTAPATYRLLANTAGYAVGSIAIGMILGGLFAWFLTRADVPGRTFLTVCVLAAMATPPFTDAIAWALLASPSIGILNAAIHALTGTSGDGPINIYSVGGMAFVTGLKSVPSAFILLAGSISRFDPTLEEAAMANGASMGSTLRRVTLPLLRPAMVGALILYVIFILEFFEIPAVLGLPSRIFVFSTLIYDASHPAFGLPNYGLISAYSSIFLVVAGVLLVVYQRAVSHSEQFAVVTGKGYRPRLARLGFMTFVLMTLVMLYAILAVVLPMATLIWTSLGLAYAPPSIDSLALASGRAYAYLLNDPTIHRSVVNTIVAALVAGTLTMVLATGVAWLSARFKGTIAALPDALAMLGFATPSIVVGLALLFFYAWLPLPIYGTVWIIVIALATRYLTYCTRVMSAAFLQINKELEEAAWMSGATGWIAFRRVVMPLVWQAFAGGWLWVAIHTVRDAALAVMLFTVTNDTVGARIWGLWFQEARPAEAAALAVCMALVTGAFSVGVIRTSMQPGQAI